MKLTREMMEKAKTAKSAEELHSMAKAENIELTEEDAEKAFTELQKIGELSDDELEKVVAGEDGYANFFGIVWESDGMAWSKNDVVYKFKTGDRVIVDCWFRNLTGRVDRVGLRIKTFYHVKYYPEYYIKFDIDTPSDWYSQDQLAKL